MKYWMVGLSDFVGISALKVVLAEKPKFLVKPQTIRSSVGDEEIRLDCAATGNPEPTITWSRNGIVLALTTRHFLDKTGTLVIKPVQSEDYGTYRCDARNKYGRASAEAEVILNGNKSQIFTQILIDPILL